MPRKKELFGEVETNLSVCTMKWVEVVMARGGGA